MFCMRVINLMTSSPSTTWSIFMINFLFRYKESISKSTKGWRERLFSRNTSMSDIGSEVRREVNAGIATVSRMMERLETKETGRTSSASESTSIENSSVTESDNQRTSETSGDILLGDTNKPAACAAGSSST